MIPASNYFVGGTNGVAKTQVAVGSIILCTTWIPGRGDEGVVMSWSQVRSLRSVDMLANEVLVVGWKILMV